MDATASQDSTLTGEGETGFASALDPSDTRILVVDDDSTVLESCESVLGNAGYRLETVRKGEEAIRRLKSRKFDIMLVDCRMPGTDGFEV
ncbi:MAG: response regulator, partial [Halobacteriales archaeon]|nr:response regulator [Halobacteriales archaeon]